MQKKVRARDTGKKRPLRGKKKSYSSYLTNYVICVVSAFIIFLLTTLVISAWHTYPVCANSKTCSSDLSLNIDNSALGTFEGKTVHPPKIDPLSELSRSGVLGASVTAGQKHIFVDLSAQTLTAYQGSVQILKVFVSTGRWNKTPTGNFHIWEKLLSTRMAGGEGADAYDLPNVPYVMYFYQDFGLHGAYWHDNFGHTMSHGCVNMRQVDAKALYEWADGPTGSTPGTAVSVCDQITNTHQCIQINPVLL